MTRLRVMRRLGFYGRCDRDLRTYLQWWAEGDELPTWVPDVIVDHWPAWFLHHFVCRLFGHEVDVVALHRPDLDVCIWCRRRQPWRAPQRMRYDLREQMRKRRS